MDKMDVKFVYADGTSRYFSNDAKLNAFLVAQMDQYLSSAQHMNCPLFIEEPLDVKLQLCIPYFRLWGLLPSPSDAPITTNLSAIKIFLANGMEFLAKNDGLGFIPRAKAIKLA